MPISTVGQAGLDSGSSIGTGAMAIPSGTTAQRPATAVTGQLRYNTTTGGLESYNGSSWLPVGGPAAVGGTTTFSSGYIYHTFTSSSSFTVARPGNFEILVVAGGGGGGGGESSSGAGGAGGGGGAGGALHDEAALA